MFSLKTDKNITYYKFTGFSPNLVKGRISVFFKPVYQNVSRFLFTKNEFTKSFRALFEKS